MMLASAVLFAFFSVGAFKALVFSMHITAESGVSADNMTISFNCFLVNVLLV